MLLRTLLWFCALGCGLMAGVYFAFSAFVMTALARADHAGVTAMNSINVVILRSAFMPLFFGTTLACAALAVIGFMNLADGRSVYFIGGGLVYVLGMFGVTMLFNVPLNNALLAVTAETRTGTAIWQNYLRRWTRWNHVRTLSGVAASAVFMFALTR